MNIEVIHPANVGWLKAKLDNKAIKVLDKYISKSKINFKPHLVGHVKSSLTLIDEDNYFFNTVLTPLVEEYVKQFGKNFVHRQLTNDHSFVLDQMWVNFQNKHEFNPVHDHPGIFSFVVWKEIPYSMKKEHSLDIFKDVNDKLSGCFEFFYTDTLGKIRSHVYKADKKFNNFILLFPSMMSHAVYPFYTSNKQRISISGNIKLDSKKIVNCVYD